MSDQAWAAVFTAASALLLGWIDRRDARMLSHEKDDDAEIAALRSRIAAVEAERDSWRERYYELRAAPAAPDTREKKP